MAHDRADTAARRLDDIASFVLRNLEARHESAASRAAVVEPLRLQLRDLERCVAGLSAARDDMRTQFVRRVDEEVAGRCGEVAERFAADAEDICRSVDAVESQLDCTEAQLTQQRGRDVVSEGEVKAASSQVLQQLYAAMEEQRAERLAFEAEIVTLIQRHSAAAHERCDVAARIHDRAAADLHMAVESFRHIDQDADADTARREVATAAALLQQEVTAERDARRATQDTLHSALDELRVSLQAIGLNT